MAVQDYSGAWQLVLMDNGSTDGSVALAEAYRDRLPELLIVATTEAGVSRVRNAGVSVAQGQLIAFADADDIVEPGWLSALHTAALSADLVAGHLEDRLINSTGVLKRRGSLTEKQPLVPLGHLPFAPGGNCAVWRHVIEAVGGWDPRYIAGSDDVDFSWRAQAAGYRLGYAPTAVLHYRYRGDIVGLCRQFYRYGLSEAQLLSRFRNDVAMRSSAKDACRVWRRLLARLPRLLAGQDRAAVVLREISFHLGRARGSFRHRVLLP